MPVSSWKEDLVKRRNVNLKISVGGKDSGKGKLESTTVIGHGNFEQGKSENLKNWCWCHPCRESMSDAVVRTLDSTKVEVTPHVGWVCCWLSSLPWEVFLSGVLQLNNQHLQIPILSKIIMVHKEPLCGYGATKIILFLLFIIFFKFWAVSVAPNISAELGL